MVTKTKMQNSKTKVCAGKTLNPKYVQVTLKKHTKFFDEYLQRRRSSSTDFSLPQLINYTPAILESNTSGRN